MILRQFSSNQPYLLIASPLIAAAVFLPALHGAAPQPVDCGFPMDETLRFLYADPRFSVVSTIVLLLLGSLLSSLTFNRNEFHSAPSYMPSLLYALIGSGLAIIQLSIPLLVANLFVLLGANALLQVHRQSRVLSEYFQSGLWFGIAALIFPPYLTLLAGLWVSILYTRAFNLREHAVAFIAFGLPFLYWVVFKFWNRDLEHLILFHRVVSFDQPVVAGLVVWTERVFLLAVLLSVLLGLPRFLWLSDRSSNKARGLKMVYFILVLAIAASAFIGMQQTNIWLSMIILLPATFIGGHWFTNYRFALVAPFAFYFLIFMAVALFLQYYHIIG